MQQRDSQKHSGLLNYLAEAATLSEIQRISSPPTLRKYLLKSLVKTIMKIRFYVTTAVKLQLTADAALHGDGSAGRRKFAVWNRRKLDLGVCRIFVGSVVTLRTVTPQLHLRSIFLSGRHADKCTKVCLTILLRKKNKKRSCPGLILLVDYYFKSKF